LGTRESAASARTRQAEAKIAGLKVTESVCPFCAVGCGELVYTPGGELVDIEGNPRSPTSWPTCTHHEAVAAMGRGRRAPDR
jgi:formate dehydrogenase major subunit